MMSNWGATPPSCFFIILNERWCYGCKDYRSEERIIADWIEMQSYSAVAKSMA